MANNEKIYLAKKEDLPVYLTQAEYDALPDTKLTDGKLYMITDADPESSGGSSVEVLDTMEEIESNTGEGKAAGALAVKELNKNLESHLHINSSELQAVSLATALRYLCEGSEYGSYSGRFKCKEGWYTIHCFNAGDGGFNSGYVASINSDDAYIFRVKAGADAVLKKLGESKTQFYSYGGTDTSVKHTFTATGSGKAHIFITARCDTGSYTVKVNGETLYNESGISSFTKKYSIDVEEGDVVYAAYTRNTTSHWGGLSMVVP